MTDMPPNYRIAIVRNVWTYFYLRPPAEDFYSQIRSSIHCHIGLLGLWKSYTTDLITVDDGLWIQRIALESFYMGDATDKRTLSQLVQTRHWAVRSREVDWNKYDAIICLDSVVPRSILKKYPRPLWMIFLTSPSASLYLIKRWLPLYGFQVALMDQEAVTASGNVGLPSSACVQIRCPFPLSFFRREDVLAFAARESRSSMPEAGRQGIHLEKHCASVLTEEEVAELHEFGPVTHSVPRSEYATTLASRKYFVVSHNQIRYLKGHSLIEANAFGCLILIRRGTRIEFSQLVTEDMLFDSFPELVECIRRYEGDPMAYSRQFASQQSRFEEFAFHNPKRLLEDLIMRHQAAAYRTRWGWPEARDAVLSFFYPLYWVVLVPLYRGAFRLSQTFLGRDLGSIISEYLHAKRGGRL